MSEKTEVTEKKANERPKFGPGARRGPGGGGPGGHMVAGEKAVNFLPSVKRLMGNLRPVRALVIIAIAIGTLSVALSVVGPKILGRATDMMLAGIIGSHEWPPGATKQSIIDGLVAQGNTDLLEGVVGLERINGLLAGSGDFAAGNLEFDFARHQHGGDDVARGVRRPTERVTTEIIE